MKTTAAFLAITIAARAGAVDSLSPEFQESQTITSEWRAPWSDYGKTTSEMNGTRFPPRDIVFTSNIVERAAAHAGEPSGEDSGWELMFPKTTAAISGILGALAIYWTYNNVDLGDSNGGPDNDAAAKLEAAQQAAAQAQAQAAPVAVQNDVALLINGTFTGSPELLANGGTFTPSLTFASATAGSGDITNGNRSAPEFPAVSGKWSGGYGNEIVVRTSDPAYVGIGTVEAGAVVLNGRRLFATAGASILFEKKATTGTP